MNELGEPRYIEFTEPDGRLTLRWMRPVFDEGHVLSWQLADDSPPIERTGR